MITMIRGTPRKATSAPLRALPTRLIKEVMPECTDWPRTISSWGMMSSIRVLTAGLKKTEQAEARNAAASTMGTLSLSVKASAPTISMISPRRASMPTMMALRLHLSTMLPLNGETNITMNMEMEDIMPIRALDPVFS